MLKDDFYSIKEVQATDSSLKAVLLLRPDHSVYQGHFPGRPVVPGACLLQMVRELLEKTTDRRLQLVSSPVMKFLHLLSPDATPALEAEVSWQQLSGDLLRVNAVLRTGETPCFRFSGTYTALS